jgi:chemotaxis response regulator CheB
MLDVLLEPYFKAINIINNAQDAISHFESTKYDVVLINVDTTEVKNTLAWDVINGKDAYAIVYAINKDNQDIKDLANLGVDTCVVESIKDDIDTLYQKLLSVSSRIEDAKAEREKAKTIIEDKVYDFEAYCDMEELHSVYEELNKNILDEKHLYVLFKRDKKGKKIQEEFDKALKSIDLENINKEYFKR